MGTLREGDGEQVSTTAAFGRYQMETAHRRSRAEVRLRRWIRVPQVSAVGAVIALILLLSFAPTRSWGQRFLSMLRVQKLAVVPIDTSALEQAGEPNRRSERLSQLISDSVVVTMKPGEAIAVPDAGAASARAGFKVETLENAGTPQVRVEDQGAFHMTLDADRMRAVLQEVGRSDIEIPDAVNGSTVYVHVPKGVMQEYGNCGANKTGTEDTCIRFLQIPSPTVSVPPGVDMPALAEAALQLAGMSATEARNFAQTVDWSSTLVIPVPHDHATYQMVPVDGVNGTLVEWLKRGTQRGAYSLIWLKNGIVHAVSGQGSSDRALAAVASLGS
jgi:hypothetical protein